MIPTRRLFFRRLVTGTASAVMVTPAMTPAPAYAIEQAVCACGRLLDIRAVGGLDAMLQPRRLTCPCGWSGDVVTARKI